LHLRVAMPLKRPPDQGGAWDCGGRDDVRVNDKIVDQAQHTIRESERLRRDASTSMRDLQTAVNRAHEIRRALATGPERSPADSDVRADAATPSDPT
jgi:hypothetical protein